MSDALYEIGEEVECFCNKCGFFGKAKYTDPLGFPHPGCNYTASPLDGSARRIEALEADIAALRDGYRSTVQAALNILSIQRDPHPDDNLQKLVNLAAGMLKDCMEADLATPSPGEKLLAVLSAWRAMTDAERDYCIVHLEVLGDQERFFGQALDALKENGDAD